MSALTAFAIITGIVLGSAIIGFACLRSGFRVRTLRSSNAQRITVDDLGLPDGAQFGERATLVQFSTQFCAKCPATSRLLQSETAELDGVEHLEIDLTDAIEVAKRFSVLQTPTVLVIDETGQLCARITGAPTAGAIRDELAKVGALPYHIARSEFAS